MSNHVSTLLDNTFDDSEYNSESFKTVIEDHLSILSHPKRITEVKSVSPVDANRFEYDFFGLLRILNVPVQYHWVVMRVNGMSSPVDFRKTMLSVKIPNYDLIQTLFTYHNQIVKRSAG